MTDIASGLPAPAEPESHHPAPPQSDRGNVEILSSRFAIGWASLDDYGQPTRLAAQVGERIAGITTADIPREDLRTPEPERKPFGYAYILLFSPPLTADELNLVAIRCLDSQLALRQTVTRRDRDPANQIFILGSPRSGTSQLGAAVSTAMNLPWLGEAHAGYRFKRAFEAVRGDPKSPDDFVRRIHEWELSRKLMNLTREAYWFAHSSASFLDKTPGVDMIDAAPFLDECFADAKFIYIHRNPVANIASRMAKFGGDFERHCQDWSAAVTAWLRVRGQLAHKLEIAQEALAQSPAEVAGQLAEFLGPAFNSKGFLDFAQSRGLEYTGAGRSVKYLSDTQWTEHQKNLLYKYCAESAAALGGHLSRSD